MLTMVRVQVSDNGRQHLASFHLGFIMASLNVDAKVKFVNSWMEVTFTGEEIKADECAAVFQKTLLDHSIYAARHSASS